MTPDKRSELITTISPDEEQVAAVEACPEATTVSPWKELTISYGPYAPNVMRSDAIFNKDGNFADKRKSFSVVTAHGVIDLEAVATVTIGDDGELRDATSFSYTYKGVRVGSFHIEGTEDGEGENYTIESYAQLPGSDEKYDLTGAENYDENGLVPPDDNEDMARLIAVIEAVALPQ